MPIVRPPSAQQFDMLNYGAAIRDGQSIQYNRLRNEAAGMELEESKDMLRNRQKAAEIRSSVDGMPAQIEELEAAGLFGEADKVRDTYIKTRKSEVELIEQMRNGISEENYSEVRQALLAGGAITPELWPVEYSDKWFREQRDSKAGNLTRFTRKSAQDGAIMSQDIVQQDGSVMWEGEWYESPSDMPKEGGGAGTAGWTFKASDSNALGKQSERLYGGFYDPATGQISGLDAAKAAKVAQVQAEAERIYSASQGQLPHAQAFAQAARKFGIALEDKSDPSTSDPLGWNQRNKGNN